MAHNGTLPGRVSGVPSGENPEGAKRSIRGEASLVEVTETCARCARASLPMVESRVRMRQFLVSHAMHDRPQAQPGEPNRTEHERTQKQDPLLRVPFRM
jgi:hypothetical protein